MSSMTTLPTPQPPPEAPTLRIDDLRQLMRSVNEATERLENTHITLKQEVARLKGELAEANVQLHRSRSLAALGEMAAGIAHEVRNPLASIGLYAQMLVEDLADRPDGARLAGRITGAVERIDTIVRDVRKFSTRSCIVRSRSRSFPSWKRMLSPIGVGWSVSEPAENSIWAESFMFSGPPGRAEVRRSSIASPSWARKSRTDTSTGR